MLDTTPARPTKAGPYIEFWLCHVEATNLSVGSVGAELGGLKKGFR
jgi:hypothetical protein